MHPIPARRSPANKRTPPAKQAPTPTTAEAPSNAYRRFTENASDFDTLIDLYEAMVTLWKETCEKPEPVPEGMEVLFRAAIVLMVSQWEAYVEDICSEGLDHLVRNVRDASSLPKEIKRQVAAEVKAAKDEIEVWKLADEGWRKFIQTRLGTMKETRDRSFNSPKSQNIADFFRKALGIEDVRKSWTFDGLAPQDASAWLDALIEVRGQIAHRGRIQERLDKETTAAHMAFLRKLVSKTGGCVNAHVRKATGKPLWK